MNKDSSENRGSATTLNTAGAREDLIKRVETSRTFEKSQRLRAFFSYVSECALNGEPESATEQQIGIHVFNRTPGYNPSEDSVVRSQARLLRWKLEQYFADEGKNEPLIISVPKGQYLPVFEERSAATSHASPPPKGHRLYFLIVFVVLAALALGSVWFALPFIRSRLSKHATAEGGPSSTSTSDVANNVSAEQDNRVPNQPAIADDGGIRIAAGYSGPSFVDNWGQRWDADRFYDGGVAANGPHDLFPPTGDARLFRTLRESPTPLGVGSPEKSKFAYNIPTRPGVYELRLYFADPDWKNTAKDREDDSQNTRHFSVVLNEQNLLLDFDPVADGATGAVDIRAFKDVTPEKDGLVHLQFVPEPERPFVNAIELTPGTRGKMKPIRISAQSVDAVDQDGTRWSADKYFIHGRTISYAPRSNAGFDAGAQFPPFVLGERFGIFSYAIPVPTGSYTVKLYFAESFFIPSIVSGGMCATGTGCRVFDVTCNGVTLLHDFDIYKAAGGGNKTVIRVFRGLHPNGQGKLLLTFSPTINYAEVRAIEVIDEANSN